MCVEGGAECVADLEPSWQSTVATTRSPGASMLWLPRMAVTSCVTSRAEAASKRERRSKISEF